MRYRGANRWTVAAACLILTGFLEGAALSTTRDHSQLARQYSVSAGVSPSFPGTVPGPLDHLEPTAAALPQASALEIPEIDALIAKAVRAGRTPGAVVIIGRKQGVVFRRAYGRRSILPEREDMTVDTIFDLASLTKPLVVAPLVQWLIETGRLGLGDPAVKYLPEFAVRDKQAVTIEQLLLHTSGLPPTNSLRDFKHGPERARSLTLGGWLYKYPGREFIYSDIGFIALGALIENVAGERLDQIAERVLWKPLGMSDTRYCPKLCDDSRIAPTELNYGWTKNPIRGEPSDTRAYRLGGVSGNAGVFSSADDVARYARMLLGEGELDGVRVLSAERVRDMLKPRPVPKAVRALGWDVSSGFSSGRGHQLSERAVGHSGYTGTSLWIDPVLDLFVIFLSNRNHPFSTGKVTDLQGQVTDFAVRALHPERRSSAALGPATADPAPEPLHDVGG
jgi:CubicO group peptidase (beta-lactamase class C family)